MKIEIEISEIGASTVDRILKEAGPSIRKHNVKALGFTNPGLNAMEKFRQDLKKAVNKTSKVKANYNGRPLRPKK